MSTPSEAAPPRAGVSSIFLLLMAAFAIAWAALAAGDAGGVGVFAFVLIGWIISLCLHEWGHAFVAWRGGDDSVVSRGYLTLNPLLYTNPTMSILLPLLFLALGGIGFPGGAVYVHPERLRGPLWRAAMSAAGPGMNLACLVAIGLMLGATDSGGSAPTPPAAALSLLGFLQATALLLNLLPVPGLDGFGILQAILPASVRAALAPVSGVIVMAFLAVMILAPQFLAPLWDAALGLCQYLGIKPGLVAEGFGLFRFWAPQAVPLAS
jgi:Zn-dependent protease